MPTCCMLRLRSRAAQRRSSQHADQGPHCIPRCTRSSTDTHAARVSSVGDALRLLPSACCVARTAIRRQGKGGRADARQFHCGCTKRLRSQDATPQLPCRPAIAALVSTKMPQILRRRLWGIYICPLQTALQAKAVIVGATTWLDATPDVYNALSQADTCRPGFSP